MMDGYIRSYCFDIDEFNKEDFNVNTFLEDCRTRNPLETIHQDLKTFQSSLENQLVAIINKDYTEFLQLSSKLKGIDEAVSSIRSPIEMVLQKVNQTQESIELYWKCIQSKAIKFQELCQEEKELQLSIRISNRMLLIEDILDISLSEDEVDDNSIASDIDDLKEFETYSTKRFQIARTSSEVCANLERAAQNYIQLNTEFKQASGLSLIEHEEKRLVLIEETLLQRLETELTTELSPDTFYHREHSINIKSLNYLFRAYVVLRKAYIPEGILAKLLIQPFVDEALSVQMVEGSIRNSSKGIETIYDSILDFIETKCKAILDLSICQMNTMNDETIDILGNVIWKPIQVAFASKIKIVFKATDPDRFHFNYKASMKFLATLESYLKSDIAKCAFRCHDQVQEFKELWNLDMYFQLRYSQFATTLQTAFQQPQTPNSSLSTNSFALESSNILWEVLQTCWNEDTTFLFPLVPDFIKISLQLLQFYIEKWKFVISQAEKQIKKDYKMNFSTMELISFSNDDDILWVGHDFHVLERVIRQELLPVIEQHVNVLSKTNTEQDEVVDMLWHPSLLQLQHVQDTCWNIALIMVTNECKKVVPALRTIKGQYQMTRKPVPTTSSTYTINIIKPISDFLEKWGDIFNKEKRKNFLMNILEDICILYYTLSMDLLKSAMELETSLKSRNRSVAEGSSINTTSDTEKMRLQLLLDLQEIEKLVCRMDFQITSCNAFQVAYNKLQEPLS